MTPEQFITEALDRYESMLIGYAKEITGDVESAKDAVQETFLRLSKQNLEVLGPRLRPWLFVVCRNCALDHVRKIVKFTPEAVEDHDPASEERSPDEQAMTSEESVRLREMVARLPLQQRELINLRFDAGLSYKEIAEALKTSVSTVGVQLHDAMQTLRNQWSYETSEGAA
jgi:RNA polymerase sigma-70 factor (ECF subfamily)